MIKLIDILREAQEINKPKAIFLTGPAGAGKTFISKQLPLGQFEVINVDDTYEEMLKASGIGMNQKRRPLVFVGIPCRRPAAVFLDIVVGIFPDMVICLE